MYAHPPSSITRCLRLGQCPIFNLANYSQEGPENEWADTGKADQLFGVMVKHSPIRGTAEIHSIHSHNLSPYFYRGYCEKPYRHSILVYMVHGQDSIAGWLFDWLAICMAVWLGFIGTLSPEGRRCETLVLKCIFYVTRVNSFALPFPRTPTQPQYWSCITLRRRRWWCGWWRQQGTG